MKKIFIAIGIVTATLVLGNLAWAAMPKSGKVDGYFDLSWSDPHIKWNRLYLTVENEGDMFHPLNAKVIFRGADGKDLGEAVFDIGIPPKKSMRVYGPIKRGENFDEAVELMWVVN